jgi:putative protease
VEQRNHFSTGDEIEMLTPAGAPFYHKITAIYDEDMNRQETAPHPQQILRVPFRRPVPPCAMLRKNVKP